VFYHCDQLLKGAYAVFLEEWLHHLGPQGVHVERFEAVYGSEEGRAEAIARVARFAGLALDPGEAQALASAKLKNGARPKGYRPSWTMPPPLRAEIDGFYRPFNEHLAQLLGDEVYRAWPVLRPAAPEGHAHRRAR